MRPAVIQVPLDILWRRRELTPGAYLGAASALSLSISMIAAVAFWLIASQVLGLALPDAPPDRAFPIVVELLGLVVLAPLAETLLLAALVGIARGLTDREGYHVLAAALPLGLLHAINGLTTADAGGHAFVSVVSFLIFSVAYVAWRRDGFKAAFWMCAGVHAIHNAVMGTLLAIGV